MGEAPHIEFVDICELKNFIFFLIQLNLFEILTGFFYKKGINPSVMLV